MEAQGFIQLYANSGNANISLVLLLGFHYMGQGCLGGELQRGGGGGGGVVFFLFYFSLEIVGSGKGRTPHPPTTTPIIFIQSLSN